MPKEAKASRAERLLKVVGDLAYQADVAGIGAVVRRAVRDIVGSDGATFVLKQGDEVYYADEDAIGPLWKGRRFPITCCVSGWSILHKRHAVVPDIFHDERIPIEAYKTTFVKSLLMMPIRFQDPVGAVGCYWAEKHEATDEEIESLRTIADAAALSFANVQLSETTRDLAGMVRDLEGYNQGVAHDLRAPLRAVTGFSELLERRLKATAGPEELDLLARIVASGKRMDAMVRDLLEYSRVSRAELKLAPLELAPIVDDVLVQLDGEIKRRSARIEVGPLGRVVGHPAAVRQALINLVANALKFVPVSETPLVRLSLEAGAPPPRLWVEDNGIGIAEADRKRLFQLFVRLNPVESFEGSGMGLAIVRRAMERLGGDCGVEPARPRGSRFYLEFPSA